MPVYALCEQALQIDNRNVRALAILALRLMVRGRNLQSVDPQADRLRADELISRALAVDSNNYLAHYARSFLLAAQRPDEAIGEAERTLALNPSFVPAYLRFISRIGRRDAQKRPMNTPMRRCGSVPTIPLPMYFSTKRGSGYSLCRDTKRRPIFTNARLQRTLSTCLHT